MTDANVRQRSADPFPLLLAQGALYTTGLQLANVAVVLPFVLAQQGIYWAAGLLYPAYTIGIILGNSLSPYVLQRSAHLKHLVIAATAAGLAILVLVSAVAARTGLYIGGLFLAVSVGTGVAAGIATVAWSEVISGTLAQDRRNDLVLAQGAIGALIAVITTLMLLPFLSGRDPAHSHLDVLWLGASGLLAAAIAAVFIGPVRTTTIHTTPLTLRSTYRQGLSAARSQSWFRRYAAVQMLFVPVTLGTAFYSIHASVTFSDTAGSLHVLVIATSIGLVVGALLWRVVSRLLGVRGMLVISAALGSTAAIISASTEVLHESHHMWLFGLVFVLATISNQAVFTAGLTWVAAYAPEQHRATLLGFGALLVAVLSTLLGATLGTVAHHMEVVGPILTILALNIIAGVAAWRAAPGRNG